MDFNEVSSSGCTSSRHGALLGKRKVEDKGRSFADLAPDPKVAAHRPGEIAADREAQSSALRERCEISVDLHERLEDHLELIPWNTNAGIAHRHAGYRVRDDRLQLDRAAARRELDRVRQQVEQHLLGFFRVTVDAKVAIGSMTHK